MDIVTYALLNGKIKDYASNVDEWLEENVDPATGYVLDRSLQMENAAAPADMVGDINDEVGDLKNTLTQQGSALQYTSDTVSDVILSNVFHYSNLVFVWKRRLEGGVIYETSGGQYSATEIYYPLPTTNQATAVKLKKNSSSIGFDISICNASKIQDNGLSYANRLEYADTEKTFTVTDNTKYIRIGGYKASGTTLTPEEAKAAIDISFEWKDLDRLETEIQAAAVKSDPIGNWIDDAFSVSSETMNNKVHIINVPKGSKIRLNIKKYTGSYFGSARLLCYKTADIYDVMSPSVFDIGGELTYIAKNNYIKIMVQLFCSQADTGVLDYSLVTSALGGISGDLVETKQSKVFHIEKDGSGDFDSLVEGIAEAVKSMDSIVYVGAGKWDLISELGSTYLETNTDTAMGVFLKNRVHVIFSSESTVECVYAGSRAHTIDSLSAFNAGEYGFTLENATIIVDNCRYCVHDERTTSTDAYKNHYINCQMKNSGYQGGARSQCIGGGLGADGRIVIDGCVFENPNKTNYGVVSYHNTWYTGGTGKSLIEVSGCYFKGTNTFRAGCFGESEEITPCLLHGNSFGSEPQLTMEAADANINMELVTYCNEIRA